MKALQATAPCFSTSYNWV